MTAATTAVVAKREIALILWFICVGGKILIEMEISQDQKEIKTVDSENEEVMEEGSVQVEEVEEAIVDEGVHAEAEAVVKEEEEEEDVIMIENPIKVVEAAIQKVEEKWNQVVSSKPRLLQLQSRLELNPYDSDTRMQLIKEVIQTKDQNNIRLVFEDALLTFPSNDRIWLQYIDYEKTYGDYDHIETIFKSCMQKVPTLALYTEYLSYILYVHTADTIDLAKSQKTIVDTYEYILTAVGSDKDAGQLWIRFLNFVKEMDAPSSYEEQQKMDKLRSIFLRAIHIPLLNIEDIWKEYDAFENNLSKLTAKKFISDQAAGYMTARGVTKDLLGLLEPLEKSNKWWFAAPPTWSSAQVQVLNQWKRYLAWEASNPLQYEDKNLLIQRVMFAYKSALLVLRFYGEIWNDAANFLVKMGKREEGIKLLRLGFDENRGNILILFTLVELLEADKVDFTPIFDTVLTEKEAELQGLNAKYDKESEELYAQLRQSQISTILDEDEGERRERERDLKKDQKNEVEARVEVNRRKAIEQLKEATTLIWIVYMRLTRRSQSIRNSRLVFSRARKSPLITNEIFTASALMEYYVNKDPIVAGKIFEVGLKTFPLNEDSVDYVLHYLDFLMSLNDDNNTRALFERALAVIPQDKAKKLWKKYIDYETQYGDLTNLNGIQRRMDAIYPAVEVNSNESAKLMAKKWMYFDMDYIGTVELGVKELEKYNRSAAPAAKVKQGGNSYVSNGERQSTMLGVNSDKFAKPDLSRWALYKPEAGQGKSIAINDLGGSGESSVVGTILIPEQLANFMTLLPRKESYNGKIINLVELISVVLRIPLPQLATPKYVPAPAGKSDIVYKYLTLERYKETRKMGGGRR